jgi:hypothetical protein
VLLGGEAGATSGGTSPEAGATSGGTSPDSFRTSIGNKDGVSEGVGVRMSVGDGVGEAWQKTALRSHWLNSFQQWNKKWLSPYDKI